MNINDRISYIINELYKGNKRAFSLSVGVSPAVIENIVGKRKSSPSFEVMNKILSSIDNIDARWLITGDGDMIKNKYFYNDKESITSEPEQKITIRSLKTDYYNVDEQLIPLYDIQAAAGFTLLFSNQNHQIPIDYIRIPNAPKCNGALSIRGDSMYPLLKSGDIACYKTITSLDDIIYGEMYLLDIENSSDRYLTAKFIQKSDLGKDYLKLVSENKHHSERDEPKANIRAVALIKVTVRYNTIS